MPAPAFLGIVEGANEAKDEHTFAMDQQLPFRVGLSDEDIREKIMSAQAARQVLENEPTTESVQFSRGFLPITPEVLNDVDAMILGGSSYVGCEDLDGDRRCAALIRFGAGFDRIDLDACTAADIMVATVPTALSRPMSTAALTHILALATRLFARSKLVYNGRWSEGYHTANLGGGLTGKTIGFVGFGNIGRDLYTLVRPFQMRHLVFDPHLDDSAADGYVIERLDLTALLEQSDFVVILCPLTDETRHLIGEQELSLMKPTAYLINVARGAIVDQAALARALAEKRICGAGLDAFDAEPIAPDDPLLALDNVVLTPHALGHTVEMVNQCSEMCVAGILAVVRGEEPDNVINRAVLDRPKLKAKLEAFRQRFESV